MANLWGKILKMAGWRVEITAPHLDKCIICVAPHTSNWDFILGLLAYKSLGREANFLMKEFWFFWPMGSLMRRLGGIPVPNKGSKGELSHYLVEELGRRSYMNLAVTPEGTRSRTSKWRRGFLYIAAGAKVPIQLGVIDYKSRRIIIRDSFTPTGDVDRDMAVVKQYYSQFPDAAKYPDKFTTESSEQ